MLERVPGADDIRRQFGQVQVLDETRPDVKPERRSGKFGDLGRRFDPDYLPPGPGGLVQEVAGRATDLQQPVSARARVGQQREPEPCLEAQLCLAFDVFPSAVLEEVFGGIALARPPPDG